MSGLLRRLAEQALGRGDAAIRPLARIPYVAPLELATETVAVAPDPDRTPVPREAGEGPHADPGADAGSPTPPEVLVEPRVSQGRTARAQIPAVGGEGDHAERPSHAHIVGTAEPGAIEGVQPSAGDPPADPAPAAPARGPIHLTLPAPLLAPPPPARSPLLGSAPHRTASGPAEVRRLSEPETNEVHVHIGRIEVTAVQEAPPAKKSRARPTRKPMSLDEYLARRTEGRT